MAKEQQDWKDSLRSAKQEGDRQDDRTDSLGEKKVKSRLMYNRRKLDKDVKRYTENRTRINSKDIDAIGRRHGFHITGTPRRKD